MPRNRNLEDILFEKMIRKPSKDKRKSKRKKGWVIKNVRPEEYLGDPYSYYTNEEVEKYGRSSAMKKAQEKIAYRVLELLELEEGASLLDVGSGPGYTATVYRAEGYMVTCVDLIPKMVEGAKKNEFEAYVGDMRKLEELFNDRKFDAVVSVSALQWIKDSKEIRKVAEGIHSVLHDDGRLVIQFYPKSEQELKDVARVFTRNGFYGEIITDWPDIPKNRTVYLVLKKR